MSELGHLPKLKDGLTLRGRQFTSSDLRTIRRLVKRYFTAGRTRISQEVCRTLNWRQPNGWLKDRACREVLRELDRRGLLALPPRLVSNGGWIPEAKGRLTEVVVDDAPITELPFSSLRLVNVKGTASERIWNALVARFHYIGFTVSVGRTIKYLVYHSGRPIAAFSFSDPAWAVKARDALLARLPESASSPIVIANSRFLVLPWVKVPNLASHLLSRVAQRVSADWHAYYAQRPALLETFVDTTLYSGTSYRAANWLYVGDTRGYGKSGNSHSNGRTQKALYLFPLTSRLRMLLTAALRD